MPIRNARAALSILLSLAAVGAVAGCTGAGASPSPTPAPTSAATPSASTGEETPAASLPTDAAQWLSMDLTDVATGETFTIADLEAEVVLVQGMAQWCPTCRSQAGEIKKLLEAFGEDGGVVAVSLDIDVNEDAASLKKYAAAAGFPWRFAVAPADLLREFSSLYGSQYLNPPSAPIILVNAKGTVLPLPAGLKSVATLQQSVTGFLGL